MSIEKKNRELIDEIDLFIKYSVDESDIARATAFVKGYRSSQLMLRLLREYYSTLPEAREEAVVKIARLMTRQGVSLFVVISTNHSYLYIVSEEAILFLAEYQKEVNPEIVAFFGFANQKDFQRACPPLEELEKFSVEQSEPTACCPACGVEEGELHLLGCVVEVCPWCDGQLCSCNCRFEKLETEEIDTEAQLEDFVELLTEKGRIPYSQSQSPSYPGTSAGLDEQ